MNLPVIFPWKIPRNQKQRQAASDTNLVCILKGFQKTRYQYHSPQNAVSLLLSTSSCRWFRQHYFYYFSVGSVVFQFPIQKALCRTVCQGHLDIPIVFLLVSMEYDWGRFWDHGLGSVPSPESRVRSMSFIIRCRFVRSIGRCVEKGTGNKHNAISFANKQLRCSSCAFVNTREAKFRGYHPEMFLFVYGSL